MIDRNRPAVIVLAGWLRETREARGISLRTLAKRVGIHPSTLSSIERGYQLAEIADVAHIVGSLGVHRKNRRRLEELVSQASSLDLVGYSRREEQFLRAAYGERATHIVEWAPSIIPEALQTPDYARSLERVGLTNEAANVERQMIRSSRQLALTSDTRRRFTFYIGETATRPDVCDAHTFDSQESHIDSLAQQGNVTVRRVSAAACPPGLIEPFTLYLCRSSAIAVAVPHHQNTVFVTTEAGLDNYLRTFRSLVLRASATPPLT
ncbi:Scr1 family TA system antitoxin-like transcriptional regulator [Amycolatopsis sp. NPDC051102]|uniref:Scr1 family TA system antitoxin-like transcriptional regulator n=1 Tax=Amycolatopsis sp. NPDC051102 TaxID=3155163 RepID=UPI00341A2B23